ncbi:MAG: hypothetical protein EHM77_05260 [Planctomycetaceae bacterium]|nr:MAG: hypothetical protein EHM77_05260 [Planctomycetaceae bacterium]
MSNASSTANVTTPDVPPPPPAAPTGVSAVNNGNGSASISWMAGSTNTSNYEVRRETYSATKGTWGSATTVASVPSVYTSIADTSGAGTFRYSVRATNSGGASAYAGPAQVAVTTTTTTTTTAVKRNNRKR